MLKNVEDQKKPPSENAVFVIFWLFVCNIDDWFLLTKVAFSGHTMQKKNLWIFPDFTSLCLKLDFSQITRQIDFDIATNKKKLFFFCFPCIDAVKLSLILKCNEQIEFNGKRRESIRNWEWENGKDTKERFNSLFVRLTIFLCISSDFKWSRLWCHMQLIPVRHL